MATESGDLYEVSMRTEVDIAADAVWSIFASGLLAIKPETVLKAARAAGIRPNDLRDAKYRADRAGGRRPRHLRVVEDPTDRMAEAKRVANLRHAPRNPNTGPASEVRRAAKEPQPGMRVCSGLLCKGQLRPKSEFPVKNKKTGQLRSDCNKCWRHRQRVRYLSVRKERLMNQAGLKFVVSEADEIVNLACADCGCPIRPGEEVIGSTALRHIECPREPRGFHEVRRHR